MQPLDLAITGGRIMSGSDELRAAIGVRAGKTCFLGSDAALPPADRVIDVSDLFVLPGVIDVHVHLRDPGLTYKEDFASGTAAAAAGGMTAVFDMPNTLPATRSVEALRTKIAAAKEKAIVDFGLYGLLTSGNLDDVSPLVDAGVIGFKCYMGETIGKIPPPSDGEMIDQFAILASRGRRASVHAENDSILQYRIARLRNEGRTDVHAHYESRPSIVEEEAVRRVITFAREANSQLHIAHISSMRALDAVREAKRLRQDVTTEVCPQYLMLDEGDYASRGVTMKVNPAIKAASDREALWSGLCDGTIDMVATDHAPHSLEEKRHDVPVFDYSSGFPGLESSVPVMLTCVNRGMLSFPRYVQVTSENPARAWGLFPKKGRIAVGSDADFTIVDMKAEWKIDAERFRSKAKYSLFDGFQAVGRPVYTIVHGNVVMDHGDIDTTNRGEMLSPFTMREG